MNRPLMLDLFCGGGGAGMGYYRAGFDVIGVDINPQPNYPFEFVQADALEYLVGLVARQGGEALKHSGEFCDAIHASPPCQHYSAMSACRPGLAEEYPDLVDSTRDLLQQAGLPWVMENVQGSALLSQPSFDGLYGVTLCGRMFGLELYRHRLFESNFPLVEAAHPRHLTPGAKAGHWKPGEIISVSGNCAPIALAKKAMGIDWMSRPELAESIPPAYTEYLGRQIIEALEVAA